MNKLESHTNQRLSYRLWGHYALLLLSVFLLIRCANIGMPDGGPKDETPPQFLQSDPPNFSVNFEASRITLEFDEFIVQKDLNKQLLISPPMTEKPLIQFKGKKIQIDLISELAENTTYTINFGSGIADNNEGNLLVDFQYVFATGPIIDSLQIKGQLRDAFTLEPIEGAVVMLYKNLHDSVVKSTIPYYVARSLKDGSYTIRNLADTSYQLVALVDQNQNYFFDLPDESIAFLDSFIQPKAYRDIQIDTLRIPIETDSLSLSDSTAVQENHKESQHEHLHEHAENEDHQHEQAEGELPALADSLNLRPDSLYRDSIRIQEVTRFEPDSVDLLLFIPSPNERKLLSKSRIDAMLLEWVFNQPHPEEFKLEFPGFGPESFLSEVNLQRDTLRAWLVDSMLYRQDSILSILQHVFTDSTGNTKAQPDSIWFIYRSKEKKDLPPLQPQFNVRNAGFLELNQNLSITAERPLLHFDSTYLSFKRLEDSLWVDYPYALEQDSLLKRKYAIQFEFQPGEQYEMLLDSLAWADYYGITNDSTGIRFSIRAADYYGNLQVLLSKDKFPYIIQLLNDKSKMIREQIATENGTYNFQYLQPGKYSLRLIEDQNANGKWDTGDFWKKIKPEPVFYPQTPIEVKSNWDLEVEVK